MTAHYRTMMQRGTWDPALARPDQLRAFQEGTGRGLAGAIACRRCGKFRPYNAHCRGCKSRKRVGER